MSVETTDVNRMAEQLAKAIPTLRFRETHSLDMSAISSKGGAITFCALLQQIGIVRARFSEVSEQNQEAFLSAYNEAVKKNVLLPIGADEAKKLKNNTEDNMSISPFINVFSKNNKKVEEVTILLESANKKRSLEGLTVDKSTKVAGLVLNVKKSPISPEKVRELIAEALDIVNLDDVAAMTKRFFMENYKLAVGIGLLTAMPANSETAAAPVETVAPVVTVAMDPEANAFAQVIVRGMIDKAAASSEKFVGEIVEDMVEKSMADQPAKLAQEQPLREQSSLARKAAGLALRGSWAATKFAVKGIYHGVRLVAPIVFSRANGERAVKAGKATFAAGRTVGKTLWNHRNKIATGVAGTVVAANLLQLSGLHEFPQARVDLVKKCFVGEWFCETSEQITAAAEFGVLDHAVAFAARPLVFGAAVGTALALSALSLIPRKAA